MADSTDATHTKNTGRIRVVRLQNRSDGTGESGVVKIDVSTLTTLAGATCTYITILRIDYSISGMTVRLDWDAATDDEVVTLAGSGALDWSSEGGITDPRSGTPVGDVKLTTIGHASGSTYDITIRYIAKA